MKQPIICWSLPNHYSMMSFIQTNERKKYFTGMSKKGVSFQKKTSRLCLQPGRFLVRIFGFYFTSSKSTSVTSPSWFPPCAPPC